MFDTAFAFLTLAEFDVQQWIAPLLVGAAAGMVVAGPVAVLIYQRFTGQTVARAREEGAKITARAEADAKSVVTRAELEADRKLLELSLIHI